MERWQIKERTRKAMAYKKRNGEVVGSIPYGYRRNGKGLVTDEDEQRVIDLVNYHYRASMSLKEIAAFLKLSGMKTRKGREWHPEQIKRLIKDYQESRSRCSPEHRQAIRQMRVSTGRWGRVRSCVLA